MIGKPITGRSFGGCIRYVVDRKEADIIAAKGVRMQNAASIIQDFNIQRKTRPGLGKAVGHIVLSWSKEDVKKLTSDNMIERAKEYMEKMNIRVTQFVIVRHTDRNHPNIHIIYNRVDNKAKTISDNNSYVRNIKVCKEMTLQHGYHLGKGKDLVNRLALKGKEKLRYQLYDAIKSVVKQSASWKEVENGLQSKGIQIAYKMRIGTDDVQGISFEKDGFKMKGSAVDRSFSYGNLDAQLRSNLRKEQGQKVFIQNRGSISYGFNQPVKTEYQQVNQSIFGKSESLLESLFKSEFQEGQSTAQDDSMFHKKKRKRGQSHDHKQSNEISR